MAAIGDLNARRGGFAGIAGVFPRPTTGLPDTARRSDRAVDIDELRGQRRFTGQPGRQRLHPEALGGVMPASQKGDTGLARQVHMLL